MRRGGGLMALGVGGGERRPAVGRAVALIGLALAGAGVALTLSPSTGLDTFVSSSSRDYRATQAMYRQFGSDPVVVLIRGRLTALLQPANIGTLSRLEACFGGQRLRPDTKLAAYLPVPVAQAKPYGGSSSPCGGLMRERAAKVVYGPATFLNRAVAAVNTEIGSLTAKALNTIRDAEAAARTLARERQLDAAQTAAAVQAAGGLALEREIAAQQGTSSSGSAAQGALGSVPSITDPTFLRQIVFGSRTQTVRPSARFSYLFPTADAAIVQVRLRAGLSPHQQRQAITWIRRAVGSPRFHISGVSYTVTGEPVLLDDLSSEISGQLISLLAVAVTVMALALLATFRRTLRLLPLATALAAVAITFGLTAAFGGTLTLADVAVFPVLLGLAVDYGIQFRSGTPRGAIACGALATAAGFLALLISPVPMVGGFGLLLVVGVAVAFAAAAVSAPTPAGAEHGAGAARLEPSRLIPEPLLASIYGAGEILGGLLPKLTGHPRRVVAVAVAIAASGWALSSHTAVQSDLTKLVPADMPALRHLEQLEHTSGTSGEIDVLVSAPDVTAAPAVSWMRSYEQRMSARFGAGTSAGTGGATEPCAHATLCPALSLPSLLQTAGGSLSSVPDYFQRAVLTPDHRYALLAFGIRLMPLSRQRRVVEQMRAALDPPQHVTAELTGAPVLAADAEGSLSSSSERLLMIVLSLALVLAALAAGLRQPRRVLVPLIPIALATGWSALLVYLLRIPLNPMSATLGTLVIAITTEFSVLLSERVCRQRRLGMGLAAAIDDAYRTTGIAVLTSALTAIAGFGVLVVSNITMLRDFGLLALIDLSVSLAGVMLVLPATLGLIERLPARRLGGRVSRGAQAGTDAVEEPSEPSLTA